MKIEITLFDQSGENPTGEVIDLAFTEHGYLSAETVRSIVQSTAERVVLQEVSLGLFRAALVLVGSTGNRCRRVRAGASWGESLGWVEESLKRVSLVAQGVLLGAGVRVP